MAFLYINWGKNMGIFSFDSRSPGPWQEQQGVCQDPLDFSMTPRTVTWGDFKGLAATSTTDFYDSTTETWD
jgi:hypothetical protein